MSLLAAAAKDTADWLSAEENYEDGIVDYFKQRCLQQPGYGYSIFFPNLTYCRDTWPINAASSDITKDMIEKMKICEVAGTANIDYLGIGSGFAVIDQSGEVVQANGGQPAKFGCSLVVAYATDGNVKIVDRINKRRKAVGVNPLQVSTSLRGMARKFIKLATYDEARDSLWADAQAFGYAMPGQRVRLDYHGCYSKLPEGDMASVFEDEIADTIAAQLLTDCPSLLRPDWHDIGVATGVGRNPVSNELSLQAEYVVGWQIPADADRPAHFPPPHRRRWRTRTTAQTP